MLNCLWFFGLAIQHVMVIHCTLSEQQALSQLSQQATVGFGSAHSPSKTLVTRPPLHSTYLQRHVVVLFAGWYTPQTG